MNHNTWEGEKSRSSVVEHSSDHRKTEEERQGKSTRKTEEYSKTKEGTKTEERKKDMKSKAKDEKNPFY